MSMRTRRQDQEAFELAGLPDEETGLLGRPIELVLLSVPPFIELDAAEDRLLWTDRLNQWDARRLLKREVTPSVLNEFVALAGQPDEAILRFARQWGPLHICKHNLPAGHNLGWSGVNLGQYGEEGFGCIARHVTVPDFEAWERYDYDPWRWEPLERWRHYTEQARLILLTAIEISEGRKVPASVWYQFGAPVGFGEAWDATYFPQDDVPDYDRRTLAQVVTDWLGLGGVRPMLVWGSLVGNGPTQVQPRAYLDSHSLFGILALQLVTALAGLESLACCSNCGQPYIASRKPSPNRRSFCKSCGKKAAYRLSKRDQRSGKATERKT